MQMGCSPDLSDLDAERAAQPGALYSAVSPATERNHDRPVCTRSRPAKTRPAAGRTPRRDLPRGFSGRVRDHVGAEHHDGRPRERGVRYRLRRIIPLRTPLHHIHRDLAESWRVTLLSPPARGVPRNPLLCAGNLAGTLLRGPSVHGRIGPGRSAGPQVSLVSQWTEGDQAAASF